jgi:alkanesulfonate monooxygenase SsuD/methylene tetrahydromethanopterin reductase-like flavin-dependent oxidoreductase (luciferase family)
MSGPRLAVAASGADAAEIRRLAGIAEHHNIDALVVGAVTAGFPNADDTYVMTAAGGVTACTRHLRIAVALSLRGSAPPLRIAEDIGVLDVMSAGRLELLLRRQPDERWSRDLAAVLGAWSGWPLDDGRLMPVTPAPVQPNIPAWTVDVFSRQPTAEPLAQGKSMIVVEWSHGTAVPGIVALQNIRHARDAAGAATVVVDVGSVPKGDRVEVIAVLGAVVAPCLRCAADEVAILAQDATDWLVRRTDLHHPPRG